jgi:hypothetical protein
LKLVFGTYRGPLQPCVITTDALIVLVVSVVRRVRFAVVPRVWCVVIIVSIAKIVRTALIVGKAWDALLAIIAPNVKGACKALTSSTVWV